METFTSRTVRNSGQAPGYLNVQYSPDAFGASAARALQNVGAQLQDFSATVSYLDRQKKTLDAQDYLNKAKDEVRPFFFDPDNGIYAQSGQNAMGAAYTARTAYDEIGKKYLDQIEDKDTRAAFEKVWNVDKEQALDKSSLHEMTQLGNYKVSVAKNSIGQSITDAYNNYNDPKALEKALQDADGIIVANSMGLDDQAVAAARAEAKSQITLAAISRWSTENPNKALDFYTEHKDSLSGKDHIVANQLINGAKDLRKAEELVARAKAGGSPAAGDLWERLKIAESSGNNMAVSEDGAIGIAQVMPDTARYMLRKLGYGQQAHLDDAGIKKLLQGNQALGEQLGRGYLQEQLVAFGGDIEAALVAYNAGPERAKAFLAHNAGKPPGQRDYAVKDMPFLVKETKPYVEKILYGRKETNNWTTPEGYRMNDSNWNLKHFQPDDLMAPTPGGRWVDARAAISLDNLAENVLQKYGFKVSVNEKNTSSSTAGKRRGTADPADNPHVEKSQHLQGRAFDVQWQGATPEQRAGIIAEARALGFTGFGFYGEGGHLHIDMGRERTWGPMPEYAKAAMKTPVGRSPAAPQFAYTPEQGNSGPVLPQGYQSGYGLGANSYPGAFAKTGAPDLKSWLAFVDNEADPGVRARAKEMLRAEAAAMDQDLKLQQQGAQNAAWETVAREGGSVSKLTTDQIIMLGPDFVNKLRTFEENRAKNDMPMDWQAWSNLAQLSPKELAQLDFYTEYRNKLDNEHFDKGLTLVREAQKAMKGGEFDAALLSGTRSAQEVIKNSAGALGWTESKNPKEFAQFSAKMDQAILAEQQIRGRQLTAIEVQDLADKLLIVNQKNTFATEYGSQGKALETFIAAKSWDQVAADDQQKVMEGYQKFYKEVPTQEEATDLYNRSMRFFLGGEPELTPAEEKMFQERLAAAGHTNLPESKLRVYYGKYLRSFLF